MDVIKDRDLEKWKKSSIRSFTWRSMYGHLSSKLNRPSSHVVMCNHKQVAQVILRWMMKSQSATKEDQSGQSCTSRCAAPLKRSVKRTDIQQITKADETTTKHKHENRYNTIYHKQKTKQKHILIMRECGSLLCSDWSSLALERLLTTD